jgi:hypothetical protein
MNAEQDNNEHLSDETLLVGSFERIEDFADQFIGNLGWEEARRKTLGDAAIPDDVLIFDREAFLRHISNQFEYIEREGQIHVYYR